MRRLMALASFLLIASSVMPLEIEPYVSGCLQYDVAFPCYQLTSATSSGWLHGFGGWGSQWEAGISVKDI